MHSNAPELVPMFYYRDKTRVQMFYFLSNIFFNHLSHSWLTNQGQENYSLVAVIGFSLFKTIYYKDTLLLVWVISLVDLYCSVECMSLWMSIYILCVLIFTGYKLVVNLGSVNESA